MRSDSLSLMFTFKRIATCVLTFIGLPLKNILFIQPSKECVFSTVFLELSPTCYISCNSADVSSSIVYDLLVIVMVLQ